MTSSLDVYQELHHIAFIHHILLSFTVQPSLVYSYLKGSGVDVPISKVKEMLQPKQTQFHDTTDQLDLF